MVTSTKEERQPTVEEMMQERSDWISETLQTLINRNERMDQQVKAIHNTVTRLQNAIDANKLKYKKLRDIWVTDTTRREPRQNV